MKIFSTPVLLIGAAVILVGGGIIFAMSISSHPKVVVAAPTPDATTPVAAAQPPADNSAPAPTATPDANAGQDQAKTVPLLKRGDQLGKQIQVGFFVPRARRAATDVQAQQRR